MAAVAVLGLLVVAGGGYFWYVFNPPLYRPGMVSAGEGLSAPLVPPAQADRANFWQVEDEIELYHFAAGQGRNILMIHGGPGIPYTQPWAGLEPLTDAYQFHYYDQRGSGQSTRPFVPFLAIITKT